MATIKHLLKQFVNIIREPYWATQERQWKNKFGKYGNHTVVKRDSTLVPKNMYLDDFVIIQDKTNFISNKGKLIVKKYTVISSGCLLIPGGHKLKVGLPFWVSAQHHIADQEDDIIIGEDCWIGAGSILLPGVKIGRGCVVGAGSVVTKDIPDYAVVAGIPARIIATKFSLEDVLSHERVLYPASERLESKYIENLFSTKYSGMKAIGDRNLSESDILMIKEYNARYKLDMQL